MPSFYFLTTLMFRDYILTLELSIREFKHMWYQIYKADYCLKHFKLVLIFVNIWAPVFWASNICYFDGTMKTEFI